MADPGTAATAVLIVIFAASLAFGVLFLLGFRRHKGRSNTYIGQRTAPGPGQPAAGAAGDGAGHLFNRLDTAISYALSGLISVYRWAFSYNAGPSAPVVDSIAGNDTATRVAPPGPTGRPADIVTRVGPPQPAQPAAAITSAPAVINPPMPPMVKPVFPAPAPTHYAPPLSSPPAPAAEPAYPSPAPQPPASLNPQPVRRPYGLQSIIDIMGDGIETAFTRMSDGIVFIFDGIINLCKWIFRIDR